MLGVGETGVRYTIKKIRKINICIPFIHIFTKLC